jgi:hypothetical protein
MVNIGDKIDFTVVMNNGHIYIDKRTYTIDEPYGDDGYILMDVRKNPVWLTVDDIEKLKQTQILEI